MTETDLYWLVYWDGQRHHVAPHHAETRQLATRHGMEHEPDLTLLAVISDEMNLSVPQMLELAEVLPPPGSPLMRPPEVQQWMPNESES